MAESRAETQSRREAAPWPKVRLGEIYDIPSSNGLSRPSAVRGEGYRMINMGELFAHDIISDIEMERVKMSDKEKAKFLVKEGDLLFARQSLVAAGAGKCSIIKNVNEPTTFESHLIRVRLNGDNADSLFYYYYFRLPNTPIKGIVNQCAQAGIRGRDLEKIQVPLPPLAIQHAIAKRLSAYDELIENNRRRIAILERKAEQLYKEWFVRRRFPGHTVAPSAALPLRWTVERLGNLADVSTGKCNREDAEADGLYPLFDRSQETKRSNEWIKDCEAIIVPGEGTSFMPRYYKGKFNLHQRCYCVVPRMKNTGKYLFYAIMLNRRYFLSVATGATVPSLRQNNFLSMKILWPDVELVADFDKCATRIFALKDTLQRQNALLAKERDLLLPRLMNGRVKP